MTIPDDRIDDFIKRWEHAFGGTLSREDARARARQLVELYKVIAKRPPADQRPVPPEADGGKSET